MNLESPDSGRRPPLEPVLPLINVVFLLLIFFMVAGHLAPPQRTDVKAPTSASAQQEDDVQQLMLVLKTDGTLFYQGQAVDKADLPALLAKHRADAAAEAAAGGTPATPRADTKAKAEAPADKPEPVRLLADAGTSLKTLRAGLETLRDAGVAQVRLVTRSESGS